MIEIEHAGKRYGDRVVVDDVSLSVPVGEIAVVVGQSGAGKSTLLRMINRLVEPSEGRILVAGRDTRSVPGPELRRGIGYVIQGNGLFPHRTVAGNIATVPRLLGWDRVRIAARVDELLDLFGLDPAVFAGRYPAALSGGEQQRVGVARALAAAPAVLLMDEPFGALDPIIRGKAQTDLKAIQRRLGTTVVMVTHDMEEAILLGDRIAVMEGGRLAQYDPPAEILADPADDGVAAMISGSERPFRRLSLTTAAEAAEPGAAEGAPVAGAATLREALAELLWSGRDACPVVGDDGRPLGRLTRAALIARAARPQ